MNLEVDYSLVQTWHLHVRQAFIINLLYLLFYNQFYFHYIKFLLLSFKNAYYVRLDSSGLLIFFMFS